MNKRTSIAIFVTFIWLLWILACNISDLASIAPTALPTPAPAVTITPTATATAVPTCIPTPTATPMVAVGNLQSLPDPVVAMRDLSALVGKDIVVVPTYCVRDNSHFYILFSDGDGAYIAEFSYIGSGWIPTDIQIIVEGKKKEGPERKS